MFRALRQTFLHRHAAADAETVSEVLLGERFEILEVAASGWQQVRLAADGYTGWVQFGTRPEFSEEGKWVTVTALRGHIYAGPAVSTPVVARLSLGAQLALANETFEEDGRIWQRLAWPQGWVQRSLFRPLPPTLAELGLSFIGTPYRWGGRSAWGTDCSGLVQVLHAAYGLQLPRDSGAQRRALPAVDRPQAGDLAFFPGHVGLMLDERRMLNATSYHMAVAVDTLGEGGEYGEMLARDLLGFGRPDWREL